MSRLSRLVLIPVILALLAGCLPNSVVSPSKKAFQSNQPRAAEPQAPAQDRLDLAAGDTAFALDLYQTLAKSGDANFFYSPYSISLALAMTYAGARGDTARQMADVLHFTLPQDRLHPALNAIDQELASRKDLPGAGKGSDGKGFRLNIVNDIWGQQDYVFLPEFLDLLAKNYGAGLRPIDFKGNPEGARKIINDYIAQKTEKRIQDLVPAGAIDPLTSLVLTNAIYFNAAWLHPFQKELTKAAPFTRLDGSQVSAPLMWMPAESIRYLAGEGFQAAALPYEGNNLSMLLLVPDSGQFASFEAGLDAARLDTIRKTMQSTNVTVKLPAYKMESEFRLSSVLKSMGMIDAFTEQADFSGMDGNRDLYISEVVHKSFVKVDEAGTEAAAATAVMMPAMALQAKPVELTIDRPFIFLIMDEPTNTVLFAGRVLDPTH